MKARSRVVYFFIILCTMALGLASRKYPHFFTSFLATYLGDTLWALLVYWLIGFLFPKLASQKVLVYALLFAYLIEISQLYQAPWINQIRDTTLGSLVLGHQFLWVDFVCYTTGIVIGFILERLSKCFHFS